MVEAKVHCPKCNKIARVVRFWSDSSCNLVAQTSCGCETYDEPFIQRCLGFESGACAESDRIHAAYAKQCPCGRCQLQITGSEMSTRAETPELQPPSL